MEAAEAALGLLAVAIAAAASAIDLRQRVIPNRLTCAGALLALTLGTLLDPSGEPTRLVAGAAAGGLLLAAALARPDGMGMGDVKLAAVLGLCLGGTVPVALAVAFGAGTLYGLAILARHGRPAYRTATMPFAPCLAAGTLAALLV